MISFFLSCNIFSIYYDLEFKKHTDQISSSADYENYAGNCIREIRRDLYHVFKKKYDIALLSQGPWLRQNLE